MIDLNDVKFVNTQYFREAAIVKEKTGVYCGAPFGSKAFNDFWEEQDHRCKFGYKVGDVRITGYHYWFLNFKQLEKVADVKSRVSEKDWGFPRFWGLHYKFFHFLEEAEKAGRHVIILKPRGTGFSEIMSSIGTANYTLYRKSKNFYFASSEAYLNKDGVLNKCWDHLEFLNQETENGFYLPRQKKNKDLHKRTSIVVNTIYGEEERGRKSEIIGRVIDIPRKTRGARCGKKGKIFFEEGGSFPRLREAVNTARPSVEQGGIVTNQIIVWGTGGEEGPGIIGMEEIFYQPDAFNFMACPNIWDLDRPGTECGFFFPVTECMDAYMDEDGNPDIEAADAFAKSERERSKKSSPEAEDKYIAEYPMTPSEALLRLTGNSFPVAELQRQLNRVSSSKAIKGIIKHGWITQDATTGKHKFELSANPRPIDSFPHKPGKTYEGCISILELPYTDSLGKTPKDLYQIVVDPYYKDNAEHSYSLGAVYVYKYTNAVSPTEDDLLVAWYVARPQRLDMFYRNLFMLAKYYNAKIQAEILGGGKGILDYAQNHKLLEYCEKEPDIVFNKDQAPKEWSKQWFMNMTVERKVLAINYLADWLTKPRTISVDKNTGDLVQVPNLTKIYDIALLQELIRFSDEGNFDRVSALLLLPFMIKENVEREIKKINNQNLENFFDRNLHSGDAVPEHDEHWSDPLSW